MFSIIIIKVLYIFNPLLLIFILLLDIISMLSISAIDTSMSHFYEIATHEPEDLIYRYCET